MGCVLLCEHFGDLDTHVRIIDTPKQTLKYNIPVEFRIS